MWLFQDVVAFQHEIYLALAAQIRVLAAGGGWGAFLAFMPMGVVFGAAHALTPGHSKGVLATYVVGSDSTARQGLLTAIVLSATHVGMAVAIAMLSLPLVSVALGSVGRAPMLETMSRGLLGLVGLWMILRAVSTRGHSHGESKAFGFLAGLIPCPLTLFVMTFAMVRGVPMAGIAFASAMLLGVGLVLCAVAMTAALCRSGIDRILADHPKAVATAGRMLEGGTGGILVLTAAWAISTN